MNPQRPSSLGRQPDGEKRLTTYSYMKKRVVEIDYGFYSKNQNLDTNPVIEYSPGDPYVLSLIAHTDDVEVEMEIIKFIKYQLSCTSDNLTALSHIVSLFCIVMPTFRGRFVTALENGGFSVIETDFESLVPEIPEDETEMTPQMTSVLVGQLCLLPFKILRDNNFSNYMSARTTAFASKAGVEPIYCTSRPVSLQVAIGIRALVGSNRGFRSEIINMMLAQSLYRKEHISGIAGSVLSLLAWADMQSLMFVYDVLIKTASPVLYDYGVVSEVQHVCRLLEKVCSFKYPQYYRIFCDPKEQTMLERNNFITLFAVAHGVSQRTRPGLVNFSFATRVDQSRVKSLIHLHVSTLLRLRGEVVPNEIMIYKTEIVNRRMYEEARSAEFIRMSTYQEGVVSSGGERVEELVEEE